MLFLLYFIDTLFKGEGEQRMFDYKQREWQNMDRVVRKNEFDSLSLRQLVVNTPFRSQLPSLTWCELSFFYCCLVGLGSIFNFR